MTTLTCQLIGIATAANLAGNDPVMSAANSLTANDYAPYTVPDGATVAVITGLDVNIGFTLDFYTVSSGGTPWTKTATAAAGDLVLVTGADGDAPLFQIGAFAVVDSAGYAHIANLPAIGTVFGIIHQTGTNENGEPLSQTDEGFAVPMDPDKRNI